MLRNSSSLVGTAEPEYETTFPKGGYVHLTFTKRHVDNGDSLLLIELGHPTAIAATVGALKKRVPKGERVIAVFEPRSNTMKLGAMRARLAESLFDADHVYSYSGGLGWSVAESLQALGTRAEDFADIDALVTAVVNAAKAGDHILIMSNGGFGGIHQHILNQLHTNSQHKR